MGGIGIWFCEVGIIIGLCGVIIGSDNGFCGIIDGIGGIGMLYETCINSAKTIIIFIIFF